MIKKLLCFLLFVTTIQFASGQEMASESNTDVLSENELSFYPNPSKDAVKVTNRSGELVKLSIFNILGDEVFSAPLSKVETDIPIDKLPTGVYIVAFYQGDRTITERLIKQ
ncbi:T9SS C-terminal target domain-containing protein [Dokdonia sinensis]|uniref:T9SS C-terminal target domain-containing protein n=1 Tax=Dokdonia sinensis TaxID=2479847 RepID=A0A3M0GIW6_9FLAO|nr:T9SS type A sorting domain-containing protein [Dokdonia sinensis]RMB61049.1 T9SS C-terminal target domain-containing protein [Dokdonia sinensis]